MTETIRIGSRGSQLALWQANHIAAALRAAGHTVEIEIIRTTGDRMQQPDGVRNRQPPSLAPLPGGKGIFIKEIEEALADGRIDLAVHSLKDLPTELDPRFTLAAIPPRADARDAWVCDQYWALHTLPMGGRIGTTSPRRRAQLLALRPDVTFVELRGNVDTRLRKLAEGQCDALVLASAGLDRLEAPRSLSTNVSPSTNSAPLPARARLRWKPARPATPSSPNRIMTTTFAARWPRSTTPKRAMRSRSNGPYWTRLAAAARFPSASTAYRCTTRST